MPQNLGIGESRLVPFSFDPFQCSADITIVVDVLSVCAATPIFFRVAATVKSSEKSGEGRRRAIYDEGTNVESGEKREILNGRERIPNAMGEGKGRSNRSGKFARRERVERRVIKREGTASVTSSFLVSSLQERSRFASSTIPLEIIRRRTQEKLLASKNGRLLFRIKTDIELI